MKIQFLRPSYFIWIIVPLALYLVYLAFGLPHAIWSYDWRDNGTHDPFVTRWYTRCTLAGPYGLFTIYPVDGKCPWLRFYKKQEGG